MGRLSIEEVVEEDDVDGVQFSGIALENPPHNRRSFHRNPSSVPSAFSVASPRKSFSYDKLTEFPIHLTVVKLDGSSFVIEITKKATIAEVKQAVENYFTHLPTDSKISWRQVWGHFCLSYGDQKLLNDNDSIKIFGISDSDELRFVRHVAADKLIKKRSKRRIDASNPYSVIENHPEEVPEEDDHDLRGGDIENLKGMQLKHELDDDDDPPNRERNVCNLFKGWVQYARISSLDHQHSGGSRRCGSGFFGFIRSICCGDRRHVYSPRVSQVEI